MAKTEVKRIAKNKTVKWSTSGRWGAGKRTGVVRAFVPRDTSIEGVKKALGGKLASIPLAHGVQPRSSVNDRYLVEVEIDGKPQFMAPRASRIEADAS